MTVASIAKYDTAAGPRYAVRWRHHAGRLRWKSVGRRKKDAERFRLTIEQKLTLGPAYVAEPEALGGFLDGWLERHQQRVRTSTARRAKEVARVLEPLRGLQVDHIVVTDIEAVLDAKASSTPRQAELALSMVKRVLRDAREHGHVIDEAVLRMRGRSRGERREPSF